MNLEAIFNLVFALGALFTTLGIGLKATHSVKNRVMLIIFVLIPSALFVYGFLLPSSVFSREVLQTLVLKFGVLSVCGLLLLQVIQVVIPPLDHNVVGMIGGYLFGPWLGFVYNLTGRVLGSIVAFSLARKLGRPFLEKKIPEKEFQKYDKIWTKSLPYVFLAYWFPFFPDDTISYIAGTSKVNLRTFFLMLILGHPVGTLGISFAGSLGMTKWIRSPLVWTISIGTLIIGLLVFGKEKIRRKITR